MQGADQFHYVQAVVLGPMLVQIEKGLKLLFIGLHQKGLQLAAVFPLEVVETRAKLMRAEVVCVTLGILEDPGVAVLLKDLLEAINHILLQLNPGEVHPSQAVFFQLLRVVIVNRRPWGRERIPPPDCKLIDKMVMAGI